MAKGPEQGKDCGGEADSALSQAFEQTKIDIQKTFEVNSLSQFASMAVADVLDLASDLLIGGMAVIILLLLWNSRADRFFLQG